MENVFFCLESHIHLCIRHTSAIPAYVIKTCLTWHAISRARYWRFVSSKLHVSTFRNQQHCWWFHYDNPFQAVLERTRSGILLNLESHWHIWSVCRGVYSAMRLRILQTFVWIYDIGKHKANTTLHTYYPKRTLHTELFKWINKCWLGVQPGWVICFIEKTATIIKYHVQ